MVLSSGWEGCSTGRAGGRLLPLLTTGRTSGFRQRLGGRPRDHTELAGGCEEVLETLYKMIETSLDAGAAIVQIKLEAPEEVR